MVVTAPYHIQKHRVLKRAGMTEEKFFAIVQAQTPDFEKCRRADTVIHTGLGRAFALKKLKQFLR